MSLTSTDHDFSLESVEVASTPMQRFEEYLQSRAKRMTQQRRRIVEHVFQQHAHFDADDLIDQMQKTAGGKVSRPTVYRTLGELVDAGLLVKMTLRGRAVYEHDYGYPSHDHLYCMKCDSLIEFHSKEIEAIRDAVAEAQNFRVTGHRLIISGICEECSRAARRPNRRLDLI